MSHMNSILDMIGNEDADTLSRIVVVNNETNNRFIDVDEVQEDGFGDETEALNEDGDEIVNEFQWYENDALNVVANDEGLGVNAGNAKRVEVEASSNPNMAHTVEPLVNSSSNDTKAGKSSVDNESKVEDIFNETGRRLHGSKTFEKWKSGTAIGNKS
nr:hypothetical protein [Tanacetum cinerariifolium]